MLMYAIGTFPLISSLKDRLRWTQIRYVDDALAGGNLKSIHEWLNSLTERGPAYGYFPEPAESYLVVSETFKTLAEGVSAGSVIQVVSKQRLLGGFISGKLGTDKFVRNKIQK